VIVEGAGSPAEVNLRRGDIANMGFARAADVPVILAGDIDRGGVIAQMVGTQAVLDPADAAMVAGFLINKFRGDPRLFDDGYRLIEARTGWRGFGVLPWFSDAWRLPAEDAMDLRTGRGAEGLHVVCLAFSRIANFDDLDPLSQEPGVRLTMLGPGRAIPGDADLVILPGTKSTRGDLAFLRAQGWDVDLPRICGAGGGCWASAAATRCSGGPSRIPKGIEGPAGADTGLGLLDVETVMTPDKRLTTVRATHAATGLPFDGYEIHIGRSDGPDRARPFGFVDGEPEGAVSADGRVAGSYLHGMFRDDAFRAAWLAGFGVASEGSHGAGVEAALDALAAHVEAHLDVDGLLAAAR
jgi:adenosylcobyric acid synthase